MTRLLDVTRDARHGARLLLENPGSSAIALVTLALGIGVTSAVFTTSTPSFSVRCRFMTRIGWWRSSRSPMRRLVSTPFRMRRVGDPMRMNAAFVSADFHQTLGVRPMLGPGLTPGDEGGIDPAAVLRA